MTERDERPTDRPAGAISRRGLLRGTAVGGVALPLLAACGGGESASGSGGASSSGGAGGAATVPAADVPVGGGTILADQKLVVTQPSKGQFKAFSAICTHQKCPVSSVQDQQIVCTCHGSRFSITDGSPVSGPATSPLAPRTATVEGDQISVS
jgi:nitrite reductase/ring-hydroxylating ferredoxin subunit